MILNNEQTANALYSVYQIYGGGCAQLAGKNFRCGFGNKNKALLNALMQACEVKNLTYRLEAGKWAINFELTW